MPAANSQSCELPNAIRSPDTGGHPIESASGRMVDLRNPRTESICLEDVAHHLARINRFTGAVRGRGINVAAHSIWVARYLEKAGHDPATQLLGLLHDAAEAYLGDVSHPLKAIAGIRSAYQPLEQHMLEVIYNALGVHRPTATQRRAIADADTLAAASECRAGLPSRGAPPRYRPLDDIARSLPVRLRHPVNRWPSYAAHRYCRLFRRLAHRIDGHPYAAGSPP